MLSDDSEIELDYANIFTRGVSVIADIAFALLVSVPLIIHAMNYFVSRVQEGQLLLPFYHFLFAPISVFVIFFVWFVCAVLEWSFFRGTPGKWLTGIAVVTGLGHRIKFSKSFLRQVLKYNFMLLVVVFPFVNLDIFSKLILFVSVPIILFNAYLILFHIEKQSFHDIIASAYVIHKRKSRVIVPFLVLIASLWTSYSVILWIQDHVVLEAMNILPEGTKEAIVKSLVTGKRDITIDVGNHENFASSNKQKSKSLQTTASQAFEFVDDSIYKDALKQDIRKVVVVDDNHQILNVKGPTYTTMEYSGSYTYEFQTYLPYVPNLAINPGAFNLVINAAYDRNGSMLTPRVEDPTLIEDRVLGDIRYILVKKKVLFAQSSPVEKVDGTITLRLPIDLKSESVNSDSVIREVKMGAQSFLITSISNRSIDFEHHGPAEYFLGIVAYEKGKLHRKAALCV
ncbi:MAG: RDD family protein [Bdellovibrionota bacterium]